jgi:hypothetical protein
VLPQNWPNSPRSVQPPWRSRRHGTGPLCQFTELLSRSARHRRAHRSTCIGVASASMGGRRHDEFRPHRRAPSRARGAPCPSHQVFLSRVVADDVDVAVRKSGRAQALGHRLDGHGHIASGLGRVDFDELLEDVERELSRWCRSLRSLSTQRSGLHFYNPHLKVAPIVAPRSNTPECGGERISAENSNGR